MFTPVRTLRPPTQVTVNNRCKSNVTSQKTPSPPHPLQQRLSQLNATEANPITIATLPKHATTMCRITAYKSTTCPHRWLTITTRCAPNVGFTTTPTHPFHSDNCSIFGKPSFTKAPAETCPNCNLKGQYDGNTVRLVLGSGEREIRWAMWREQQGGLVGYGNGYMGGWDSGCRVPDVTALGVYQHEQQWLGNGYQQTGMRYYPVAQKYSYGYGQALGSRPSSCNIM